MKQAVIAISGSQFKVEENQKLSINNLNLKEGEKVNLDQVLLVSDGQEVKVGAPTIKGASVCPKNMFAALDKLSAPDMRIVLDIIQAKTKVTFCNIPV